MGIKKFVMKNEDVEELKKAFQELKTRMELAKDDLLKLEESGVDSIYLRDAQMQIEKLLTT